MMNSRTEDHHNTVRGFVHGEKLFNKLDQTGDGELERAFGSYLRLRENISGLDFSERNGLIEFTNHFNAYRDSVLDIFDSRENSGQEILRSTILEEMFQHLFAELVGRKFAEVPRNLHLGSARNSYVSLSFAPRSFESFFSNPGPYIHSKDQDFVLGCLIDVRISPSFSAENETVFNELVVPVVAIECKTYLEKNMLDSCASTATRIKRAMPYCLYIVATEYLKMRDSQPELTDIDEIFVLCRAANSDRLQRKQDGLAPHPIDPDLIESLYLLVEKHLNKIWWSPEDAVSRGTIINRP